MNYRERTLTAVAGGAADVLPFVPRLDLWYKANTYSNTLPKKYRHASLMDIVEDLDVGYHCLLPDFSDFESEDGDLDIGLGVYHLKANCYKVVFHNLKRTVNRDSHGGTRVTYHTPKGDVSCAFVLDERMKASGLTLWVVKEHLIKSEDDWEAAAYIFENAEILPRYERLLATQQFLGDRAEAVAYAHTHACAMHLLIKDLMPLEDFYFALFDDEERLSELGARIEPFMDRLFDVVSNAPSRLVFSGGNYDSAVTAPSFFHRHMLPQIQKRADACHAKNKYLICHTDGENVGLMDDLVASRFDVADSICPAPMTKLDLSVYLEAFRGQTTIWGGIPSIAVLEETMGEKEFRAYIDQMFEKIGDGRRIVLSIADTTPPGAKFERIERIARMAREFGAVR